MSHTSATHRVSMLEAMLLIRAYEESARRAARRRRRPAPAPRSARKPPRSASSRALEPRDRILTNHRSAGHLLARGADPGRLIAEVMGQATGYCKGKSGSLHISAKELGVVLTSTIVGGELSLATGVALSQKMGQGRAGAHRRRLLRRRRGLRRHLPRGPQPRRDLGPAGALRLREQPVAGVRAPRETMLSRARRRAAARRRTASTATARSTATMSRRSMPRRASRRVRSAHDGKPVFLETYTYRQRGHFEPDDQAYVDPAELARVEGARSDRTLQPSACSTSDVMPPGELAECEQRVGATDRRRPRVRRRTRRSPTPASSPPTSTPDSRSEDTMTMPPTMHRPTMPSAEALAEEMRRDPRVVMFGEGVATKRPELVAGIRRRSASATRRSPRAIIAGHRRRRRGDRPAAGHRPAVRAVPTLSMDELVNSAGKLRYLSGGQFELPAGRRWR